MENRSNSFSFEDRERRESAQFITVMTWILGPDPDPTYDRVNGWKLDQFAMAFEPELVRKYKRLSKAEYPTPLPTEPFVSSNPFEKIEIKGKLSGATKRHLLNPRFEVRGIPFGENEPVVIHKAMLESMFFGIEISEVREQSVPYETARRFDHVRVFRLSVGPGVGPQYDWRTIAKRLEREGILYPTNAALVRFCRENVLLLLTGEKPDPIPDDKTAREIIEKLDLWTFSKQNGVRPGK